MLRIVTSRVREPSESWHAESCSCRSLSDLLWVQSVKDMPVVQDGPPPGGFPSIRYARRLPSTGPTGFTLFAVATAVMAFGFYRVRMPIILRWATVVRREVVCLPHDRL